MRKRKSVQERKEEVFSAINQIIAEKGFSEVSTTEVAKKLGVTQPAIYKYFSSKDEMILYYLDYIEQQLKEILKKAQSKENVEEQLKIIYQEYLLFIEKTKIIPRIIFSDVIYLGSDKKLKRLKDILQSFEKHIKEIFKKGKEKGLFNNYDEEALVKFYTGSMLSLSLDWMINNMNYPLSSKADHLFNHFKKGFFN